MRLFAALCIRSKGPPLRPAVGDLTLKYSNLPERYVRRAMRQIECQTPKGKPQYLNRTRERVIFKFSEHRPWTQEFHQDNMLHKKFSRDLIEPVAEWSFFRGDRVEILVGKDKGKQGMVSNVFQEKNWIIVEGLNTEIKMMAADEKFNFPGIATRWEKPLLVTSEVKLVDPSDLKSTDIEWRFTEEGDKVRVSMRTGRIIPIPPMAEETVDYKTKSSYREGDKDTHPDDLTKITFEPKLCTFDMEIADKMGIKEDRVAAKTYWY
ncbi:large ribosomal subunit protein uL24m [Neocloeon triangulifer]|uniref:large ribosomal subunit protein uL24m n=1 Tax=Neocloeon triangulifer TaxID=2078957 RepID=UPI00286F7B99|nr:large ribosomal subunit protein uL24m [Neocloeon triangulifer]